MKQIVRLLSILLFVSMLVACGEGPAPTETAASPTASASNTPAPRPTATQAPAASPTPTPVPIPLEVELEAAAPLTSFPPDAAITVRFNQPMDVESAPMPLLLAPFSEGQVSWDQGGTVLTFAPQGGLSPGTTYLVGLDQALATADGQRIEGVQQWELTTLAAPRVTRRSPRGGPLQDRQPTIEVRFDRPMDRLSVGEALSIEPPVLLAISWEGEALQITPEEPLAPGTNYTLRLSSGATSTEGVPLAEAVQWSYRTFDLVSRITTPQRANDAALITLAFAYQLDREQIRDALTFEPPIVGDLTWNEAGTVATFAPAAPLAPDTAYTLAFSGPLSDTDGNDIQAPEPFTFRTPPPILENGPQGDAVHPAAFIEILFDRPMDPERTAAALQVSPPITGTLEWRENRLILRPEQNYLAEFTHYTVTLTTEAIGLDGELVLNDPFTWTFSTDQLQDIASFGEGPNAQVLDADGRRALQFQLFQQEPVAVAFELYRLSLPQFLDRYASGFRGVAGWEDRPISTDGTTRIQRWEMITSGSATDYRNIQEVVVPADVPPGLYILNLVAGNVNDQLILMLTRNAVVVKQAENQLVAWVSDINGDPAGGIEVSVYARDGELIASGVADENGLYRTAIAQDPQPLIVTARDGEDVTASGLSNEWQGSSGWWWGWWQPQPRAQRYAVYAYTDRPIYRPGQTVFFKAIIRQDDDAILNLVAAATEVTARIRDARNNIVRTLTLATNHFGTADGEFELAEGAMLGDYAVEIVVDGESHRQTFKVEDYRKPDYEVTVTTGDDYYIEGDAVQVMVDSRYFLGEPVPNAELVVNRYYLGQVGWWWGDSDQEYTWYQHYETPTRAQTDADGRFVLTLPAEKHYATQQDDWRSNLERSRWAVEVTVDDGSHQTVSGTAIYDVYSAAEKVVLETNGYAKRPGQPFTALVEATTVAGEPVGNRTLELRVLRYSARTYNYDILITSAEITTDSQGRARTSLTVTEPGYYWLQVTGIDRSGNTIESTGWIYVFSQDFSSWYGRDGDLNIEAEFDTYIPGDTARLLIESTFSGPALLTFERGTTRREQLVALTAPLTLIEVPIRPDDAPNIFVTVNAWEAQDTTITDNTWESLPDSTLHIDTVELRVPVTGKGLNVTITPNQEVFGPREEATITVRVTNSRGEPVSAEVSLALVDEAIYALSDELAGPILDGFYSPRDHAVRTYNSMALRRYLGGGRGGGGGGGDLAGNPRSDFPDTAEWFPVLYTDANGNVTVTFTLPDSLTRWRLTARAVTADTQVGEITASIVTRQEVVVRPILPRILTTGDSVMLSAIVHNYSGGRKEIAVALQVREVEGVRPLAVSSPLTQTISLGAGELGIVGWHVNVAEARTTEIVVRADIGEETADAVLLTLPIQPLAVPDVTSQVGQFTGELATAIPLPAGALSASTVRIELSRSIAGSLLHGLEFLTGFPYGCVEQTMSKALPNAAVGRALDRLGVSDPTLLADLPGKINAGLQRLYGYQHNDGGWGWWYDDLSDDYQTAWVVFGLAVTAEAGYEVDPAVIERGVAWLADHLAAMDIRSRAYALYSMARAGHGDLTETEALFAQMDELDTFSRAALALTLQRLGARAQAGALVDTLAASAVIHDGKVSWTGDEYDGHYHQKTMSSAVRSTALALSAFVEVQPGHALEPGIVRWLISQRRQEGWGSTNETSYTVLALTDHLLASREGTAETTYTVVLNGATIAEGSLGPAEPAVSLTIPATQMETGVNSLRIRQSGEGRLYYSISSRVYLAEEQIEPAGVIDVTREYLDLSSGRLITTTTAGELVEVRLTFTLPERGSYLVLEDRVPGGLEPLNERLNTTSHVGTADPYQEPIYFWQEHGYNHKEIYGDRVSFFFTELDGGMHTYTYLARATHSGDFVALPAEVWAMYDLATWGRSSSSRLEVTGEP